MSHLGHNPMLDALEVIDALKEYENNFVRLSYIENFRTSNGVDDEQLIYDVFKKDFLSEPRTAFL